MASRMVEVSRARAQTAAPQVSVLMAPTATSQIEATTAEPRLAGAP